MSVPADTEPRLASAARWISTGARLVLGGVLIVAGALKVIDPQSSVAAVRAYKLLPATMESIVGWGLPFAEIAMGLLLVAGIASRAVAAATAMLLLVFIFAVASAWVRGLSIDCGCFGGGGEVAPGQTAYGTELVRDVGLLLLALWLVWQPRSRFTLDGFASSRSNPHGERHSREPDAMNNPHGERRSREPGAMDGASQ